MTIPRSNVKKIMKSAGENVWIAKDAIELMMQLTEEYIRKVTAKAIIVARNAGCKNRVRKQDLEIAML